MQVSPRPSTIMGIDRVRSRNYTSHHRCSINQRYRRLPAGIPAQPTIKLPTRNEMVSMQLPRVKTAPATHSHRKLLQCARLMTDAIGRGRNVMIPGLMQMAAFLALSVFSANHSFSYESRWVAGLVTLVVIVTLGLLSNRLHSRLLLLRCAAVRQQLLKYPFAMLQPGPEDSKLRVQNPVLAWLEWSSNARKAAESSKHKGGQKRKLAKEMMLSYYLQCLRRKQDRLPDKLCCLEAVVLMLLVIGVVALALLFAFGVIEAGEGMTLSEYVCAAIWFMVFLSAYLLFVTRIQAFWIELERHLRSMPKSASTLGYSKR